MSEQLPLIVDPVAALNAAEPNAPRLVLMEIWRPLRYIGSVGPRTFWRECLPYMVPKEGRVIWADPSPWRVMDKETARKALSMPNNYFTLDEFPNVTFCVRKFKGGMPDDWRQIRALREGTPR